MVLNYYIDESGNSGDVLNSGEDFNFCGQPVFSLACIGVDEIGKLEVYISALKSKYKIQGVELKSTKIYKNKPNFIVELIEFLRDEKIPIFIEVVDKKYYISANIVNCHVMPPYSSPPETPESQFVRNSCADFIYENAPLSVFNKFLDVCRCPSDKALLASFNEVLKFAKNYHPANEVTWFLVKNIEESISDYEELMSSEQDDAYMCFIPIPDSSKRNKSIWMLPNLSSFTNLYARINRYVGGKVSSACLFHDEQAHFDEIISMGKTLLEELDLSGASAVQTADYEFSEAASLTFAKSHEHVAIQVADILAGVAMRYLQEKLEGKESSKEVAQAYDGILRVSNPNLGLGVNLVTTSKIHHELHY
jgi:hypothetical protein